MTMLTSTFAVAAVLIVGALAIAVASRALATRRSRLETFDRCTAVEGSADERDV